MIRLWKSYPRNNAHCKSTISNNKVNHERSDCERSVLLQSNYPLDHRNKSCNWPFIRCPMQFWPMNGDHGGVCVSRVCSARLPSPNYFGNYIFIARKQVNNSRESPLCTFRQIKLCVANDKRRIENDSEKIVPILHEFLQVICTKVIHHGAATSTRQQYCSTLILI